LLYIAQIILQGNPFVNPKDFTFKFVRDTWICCFVNLSGHWNTSR